MFFWSKLLHRAKLYRIIHMPKETSLAELKEIIKYGRGIDPADEKEAEMRKRAVFAVRAIGSPRAIALLLEFLGRSPYCVDDETFCEALGQLGETAVNPIIAWINEGIEAGRNVSHGFGALARTQSERAIPFIMDYIKREDVKSVDLSVSQCNAIGALYDATRDWEQLVLEIIENRHGRSWEWAITFLTDMMGGQAAPGLIKIFNSTTDKKCRYRVVQGLIKILPSQSGTEATRRSIIDALRRVEKPYDPDTLSAFCPWDIAKEAIKGVRG